MEKNFRSGSNILSSYVKKHTAIASSCYWISFPCTCNTTSSVSRSLALKSASFQWGTLPYYRYWIKRRVWDQVQHATILYIWQSIGIDPFKNN
jgi:hypothetical protein